MDKPELVTQIETSHRPVVVVFWAKWCTACKSVMPLLRELAATREDDAAFVVVDAGASREVASHFRVMATPTVVGFRDGVEVGRVTGAQGREAYMALFEAAVTGVPADSQIGTFDRALRLGAGALFALAGLTAGSWVLGIAGLALAFYGIHDRCPVWQALKGRLRRTDS